MSGSKFLQQLEKQFGSKIAGSNLEALDPWIEVQPAAIADVCRYLRDDKELLFNMLNCITVVDYFEPDAAKAKKVDWQPHLELVYHLSSITKKHNLVVKAMLPRWHKDVPGELPHIPSVTGVWSTADWHEREVFDLSGVLFDGHSNLNRILCPEDWVGHPLRKDYEMPLEYHGIRGR